MGYYDFELSDFQSDTVIKREYFKYVNGKIKVVPTNSWGLNVNY